MQNHDNCALHLGREMSVLYLFYIVLIVIKYSRNLIGNFYNERDFPQCYPISFYESFNKDYESDRYDEYVDANDGFSYFSTLAGFFYPMEILLTFFRILCVYLHAKLLISCEKHKER